MRSELSPATRSTGTRFTGKSEVSTVMRAIFLACIMVFPGQESHAQLKTYFVPETGPAWDISRVSGGSNLFANSLVPGSVWGISLWQEVLPDLSIGTGIYTHQYASWINPSGERPLQPSVKSHRALLVPARVSYRLKLPDSPLSLTAMLGYEFGLLTGDPLLREASSLITSPEGVTAQYSVREEIPLNRSLHMIQAGVSADYRLPNNWQFSLRFSHSTGLREIKYTTVDYTTSGGETSQATYTHDGSRMQTTLNLGIPVSNIWENRDLRLRRRVENSLGRGGLARRNTFIYFGGDLGALWRAFSNSNPAIGARPMESTGIFRYANLHAGIYAGYMFSNFTAIDIGAWYQRSSLFYSIMYDHEDDYNELARAPLVLDIPVMFRYYQDLYKNKLFLVPAMGVAVLTHFSGASYASGDAGFNYQAASGTPADGSATYVAGRPARIGFAARASLGLEYDIPTPFPLLLTWNLTYSQGMRDLETIEITTSLPENPEVSTVTYSGTGWMTSIGVRIPISTDKDNRKCGAMPRMRR